MPTIKAVIFDWAGTTIDFGSFAPASAFVRTFAEFGVPVSTEAARGPMGLPKRDHIIAMLAMPDVARAWQARHGRAATEADIEALYQAFLPLSEETVADHATLVPGTAETVRALRARGLKIGSTTGYTRSIMQRVLPLAAAQGYAPDNLVCSDDLSEGRPGPLAMYQSFVDLAVYPPRCVVKVDDTAPGIGEGVAAGCIAVGVALSGNDVAMTPDQLVALSDDERDLLRARATATLQGAGAAHVIDTVADLPALLDRLEAPAPLTAS